METREWIQKERDEERETGIDGLGHRVERVEPPQRPIDGRAVDGRLQRQGVDVIGVLGVQGRHVARNLDRLPPDNKQKHNLRQSVGVKRFHHVWLFVLSLERVAFDRLKD